VALPAKVTVFRPWLRIRELGTIVALHVGMAWLNDRISQRTARQGSARRPTGSITFVSNGEERRVDLGAPMPIRRGRDRMVQLIDLWVASLLPGDILDRTFEIVTSSARGAAQRVGTLDALHFARGFIVLGTCELWWRDPADGAFNGRCVESIVVRVKAEPLPLVALPRPRVARAPSASDLRRLLPHTAAGYPFVEWRSA
jgi:hypothetical protein